jgi:transposase-like protein
LGGDWILILPKPFQIPSPAVTLQKDESEHDPAASGARLESVSRRRHRRVFTAAQKLSIVREADAALASGERGALEALLRKRGLYSGQLSKWREQVASQGAAGLVARRPGRKAKLTEPERRVLALTKRNEVLERQLHVATALIDLQKKAHAILNLALPESEEGS